MGQLDGIIMGNSAKSEFGDWEFFWTSQLQRTVFFLVLESQREDGFFSHPSRIWSQQNARGPPVIWYLHVFPQPERPSKMIELVE
jgi:hypothetical protein